MTKTKNKTIKLILAAFFMALGLVLPLLTSQIKEIGDTLLPMHMPVLLCGIICGPWYGLAVGGILPFFRSLIFGMPPIYPTAVWMAAELLTYGLVIGLFYHLAFKRKNIFTLYASLIIAMLSGRVVWGIVKAIILGLGESGFTAAAFITGGFIDALPGIILQLILVPAIVMLFKKITKNSL